MVAVRPTCMRPMRPRIDTWHLFLLPCLPPTASIMENLCASSTSLSNPLPSPDSQLLRHLWGRAIHQSFHLSLRRIFLRQSSICWVSMRSSHRPSRAYDFPHCFAPASFPRVLHDPLLVPPYPPRSAEVSSYPPSPPPPCPVLGES